MDPGKSPATRREESAGENSPAESAGKRRIVQKEVEYPNIQWDNLSDPGVQRCVILYNDRIISYRKIVEIDKIIDQKPTIGRVKELAELRIRNLQAFRELEEYNNTGKFVNKHPLVKHFSIHEQLMEMLRDNPGTFLKEYANTRENVKRYKSFLKRKGRDPEQKKKDAKNLQKHTEREELMTNILSEQNEKGTGDAGRE